MKRFFRILRHAKQLKQQGVLKRSPWRWAWQRWLAGDTFITFQ